MDDTKRLAELTERIDNLEKKVKSIYDFTILLSQKLLELVQQVAIESERIDDLYYDGLSDEEFN